MAVNLNDKLYYWVDTICVDEVIYDVYQSDDDEVIYKAVDTLF